MINSIKCFFIILFYCSVSLALDKHPITKSNYSSTRKKLTEEDIIIQRFKDGSIAKNKYTDNKELKRTKRPKKKIQNRKKTKTPRSNSSYANKTKGVRRR